MIRVVLAIEDYTELLYLQTLLKKIGFDVAGVQNERALEETRLGINPEVIIISAKGRKLKGLEYALHSHKVRGLPKIVVVFASQREIENGPALEPGVDGRLISPINPKTILTLLARLGGMDGEALLEKYRKIKTSLSPEEKKLFQRGAELEEEAEAAEELAVGTHAEMPSPRELRYREFLKNVSRPPPQSLDRNKITAYNKAARQNADPEEEKKLNEEKQAFVKALFKKD